MFETVKTKKVKVKDDSQNFNNIIDGKINKKNRPSSAKFERLDSVISSFEEHIEYVPRRDSEFQHKNHNNKLNNPSD